MSKTLSGRPAGTEEHLTDDGDSAAADVPVDINRLCCDGASIDKSGTDPLHFLTGRGKQVCAFVTGQDTGASLFVVLSSVVGINTLSYVTITC